MRQSDTLKRDAGARWHSVAARDQAKSGGGGDVSMAGIAPRIFRCTRARATRTAFAPRTAHALPRALTACAAAHRASVLLSRLFYAPHIAAARCSLTK